MYSSVQKATHKPNNTNTNFIVFTLSITLYYIPTYFHYINKAIIMP